MNATSSTIKTPGSSICASCSVIASGGLPLAVVDSDDHLKGVATLELLGGVLRDGALLDEKHGAHPAADRELAP